VQDIDNICILSADHLNPSITNCLVAIVHTKPVTAILLPKLVAMAMSLSTIPWAHTSPQPKRHLDRFSCLCRHDGRVSLYFTMGRPSPQDCPFPWGIWIPI